MYLVDANVLSEATRPNPSIAVMNWLTAHEAELVVTPIVLGEIAYGIRLMPAGRKRTRLQEWFEAGIESLEVLPIDAETSRHWAELLAKLKRNGRAMPVKDSLIAASALQHSLTVATRNTADFRHAGVKLVDPFVR